MGVILGMEDHSNVLKYFGSVEVHLGGPLRWTVVWSEVCTGTLQDFLNRDIFTTQGEHEQIVTFWHILSQILKGWGHCRYNNPTLIHRDIKMSNSKSIPIV
jgi:hypothetical protein